MTYKEIKQIIAKRVELFCQDRKEIENGDN